MFRSGPYAVCLASAMSARMLYAQNNPTERKDQMKRQCILQKRLLT